MFCVTYKRNSVLSVQQTNVLSYLTHIRLSNNSQNNVHYILTVVKIETTYFAEQSKLVKCSVKCNC